MEYPSDRLEQYLKAGEAEFRKAVLSNQPKALIVSTLVSVLGDDLTTEEQLFLDQYIREIKNNPTGQVKTNGYFQPHTWVRNKKTGQAGEVQYWDIQLKKYVIRIGKKKQFEHWEADDTELPPKPIGLSGPRYR